MKICPIAIAVGCAKCPVVRVCPLKGIVGDYVAPPAATAAPVEAAPAPAPRDAPAEAKPRAARRPQGKKRPRGKGAKP